MYILPVYNSTYARLNNTGSALRAAPAFKAQRCTMFLNSKELNFVNNILKKCVYSKKSMLVNPDFKLKIKGNTAILKNFYQNMDTPHRTEGICEELVFKTGNILSEQFSNKYHVNAVNCLTSAYGMLHNFIFITPKTPENTEAINTLLKVSRHLKVLADYLKYAGNLAFGRPPYCILRIGDFFYTKIVITSLSIRYENNGGVQWDLNQEGAGVQPMYADVSINFNFIGGQDLSGPVERLQNAVTANYYANASVYSRHSDNGKGYFDALQSVSIQRNTATGSMQ